MSIIFKIIVYYQIKCWRTQTNKNSPACPRLPISNSFVCVQWQQKKTFSKEIGFRLLIVIPLLGQILILFEMSYKYGSNNDKFLWQMYGNKNMGQYAAPPTHYFYQLYIWKPEKLINSMTTKFLKSLYCQSSVCPVQRFEHHPIK